MVFTPNWLQSVLRRRAARNLGVILPPPPDKAIALLTEWEAAESGYEEQSWPEIQKALEADRTQEIRRDVMWVVVEFDILAATDRTLPGSERASQAEARAFRDGFAAGLQQADWKAQVNSPMFVKLTDPKGREFIIAVNEKDNEAGG